MSLLPMKTSLVYNTRKEYTPFDLEIYTFVHNIFFEAETRHNLVKFQNIDERLV